MTAAIEQLEIHHVLIDDLHPDPADPTRISDADAGSARQEPVADIRRLLEVAASPIGTPTRTRFSPPTVAGPPTKTKRHKTEGR
jgi:hypothetical protein